MDGGQGAESDNRSAMRAPSLLSSQQPTTSPPSHKAPSSSLPCPWHAKAGRQAHRRDSLLSTIFKTFWLDFGGEGLGVDFVKESKWGASECRGCSILICVCGRFLSGSFPCIAPWIPQCWGPPTHFSFKTKSGSMAAFYLVNMKNVHFVRTAPYMFLNLTF